MFQWYFHVDGKQIGPISQEIAKVMARENQGAYCWREGLSEWKPVYEVSEIWPLKKDGVTPYPRPDAALLSPKPASLPFAASPSLPPIAPTSSSTSAPAPAGMNQASASFFSGSPLTSPQPVVSPATAPATSPTPTHASNKTVNASSGYGHAAVTEGIDYRIYGHDMQFVEIELDPQESAIAEAGAMMYKSAGVQMQTIFGDGSERANQGFDSKLMGAAKRWLVGEGLFTTVFTQSTPGKGRVAFAAPVPGTIVPLHLTEYQGTLICQKDSFLCASKGVQIGVYLQKRILTGLFGGDGFIMQKLQGEGWVFIHMGGTMRRIDLPAGEVIHVDTGCLAAMTSTIDFDIEQVGGGVKSMLFGGEGLFFARLRGPGTIWLQSLPFSRLAGRISSGRAQSGAGTTEGSLLGGLGDLFGR
jgi:uncharacterized protein (TIGR00266 family)